MLGRITYLPLIYLCFTVFVVIRLTALQVTLQTLLFAAYFVFYWDDIKSAIGLSKTYSFLEDAQNGFNLK
jgi:hypothetical protein